MKHLLLTAALFACQPAFAGGPVIVTEEGASAATEPDRKIGALPWIIGGLAIAAIIIASGGDNCTVEETTPDGRCD